MKTMEKLPITAIVLTRNEGRNLEACLESIKNNVEEIIVVDSNSTDNTLLIAKKFNCQIYNHQAATQSSLYQWVIDEVNITTPWVLRIDADERWTKKGFNLLQDLICIPTLNGIYVNRKTYFMHQWIKHGGFYPIQLLLVWRAGKAHMENRMMDEHIFVDGQTITSNIDVIESNYDRQENLGLWTSKHNFYSDRYAAEAILKEFDLINSDEMMGSSENITTRKVWLRSNIYDRSPLFFRCALYFMYRYIFQMGFLDGYRGFIYHYLQAFWFRFLTDAKIYQLRNNINGDKSLVLPYLEDHLGIQVKNNKVYFIR